MCPWTSSRGIIKHPAQHGPVDHALTARTRATCGEWSSLFSTSTVVILDRVTLYHVYLCPCVDIVRVTGRHYSGDIPLDKATPAGAPNWATWTQLVEQSAPPSAPPKSCGEKLSHRPSLHFGIPGTGTSILIAITNPTEGCRRR